MSAVWPQLRAALVALHLAAITLMAIPSPGGAMQRQAWKNPTVQEELAFWTAQLQAIGLSWTQDEVEDVAWTVASSYTQARTSVLKPLMPYYRLCGTWQSWQMFVAPHRYPALLHIDIERGAGWEPIYVGRSPEHTWRARSFDHDRMRASVFRYGWQPYRRHYQTFTTWVAEQVAQDFPTATQVRVRMYHYRTASPEEVREDRRPEGQFKQTMVRELEPLR